MQFYQLGLNVIIKFTVTVIFVGKILNDSTSVSGVSRQRVLPYSAFSTEKPKELEKMNKIEDHSIVAYQSNIYRIYIYNILKNL